MTTPDLIGLFIEPLERSGSDRHLRDISMMLRVSGDILDQDALDGWLSRLELAGAYAQARRYPPG